MGVMVESGTKKELIGFRFTSVGDFGLRLYVLDCLKQ